MSDTLKDEFIKNTQAEYETVRERRKNKKAKTKYLSYQQACENRLQISWDGYQAPKPEFTGVKVFDDYPLEELVDYIDWTPFFITWDLACKYPRILCDEQVGDAATNLFNDAQVMLKKLITEKHLTAKGVIGFWPANSTLSLIHI